MDAPTRKTLSEQQRTEATRRVMAGEKASALALEYGVTRAYISLLKAYVVHPERYETKRLKNLKVALSAAELAEFRNVIETSDPSKLDLDPPTRVWCMDHGYQLAERMFGKRPSVRVMKESFKHLFIRKNDRILRRPQPPEPHHISQLTPEFAKNEEFLEYYLSPLANKLAKREYELALADWISRYGDATEIDLDLDLDLDLNLDGHPQAAFASHQDGDDLLPPPAAPPSPLPKRNATSEREHSSDLNTEFGA